MIEQKNIAERFDKIQKLSYEFSELPDDERDTCCTATYAGKIVAQLIDVVKQQQVQIKEQEKRIDQLVAVMKAHIGE